MNAPFSIPRLLIAGTSSGVGKTTLVVGLIAAIRRRGLVVQPFKCGPDYIDAGHHSRAAGRPCRNLDTWMLGESAVADHFVRACRGADLALIEGVMGLFDGSDFEDERGSAAHVAKLLSAPVLLVTDISGSARSAAATLVGFDRFDPELRLSGCLLNFAGSKAHAEGCSRAIRSGTGVPVLGWLQREESLRLGERHLGLVQAAENKDSETYLRTLAEKAEAQFDIDRLLAISREAPPLVSSGETAPSQAVSTPEDEAPLLAVARDDAFSFYYPDNLELLQDGGVRISYFSPLAGECPPPESDGVYLGGGYPELHAASLSSNAALWSALRRFRAQDAPLFAECGGFMVLTEGIVDLEGRRWPMAGLVPGWVRMTDKIAALGYREAFALSDNLISETGTVLRGHEFHYSVWEAEGADPGKAAWRVRSVRSGEERPSGFSEGGLLASYLHVQLCQNPACARRFAAALGRARSKRKNRS